MRAIVYLYCSDSYINIPADKAEIQEDHLVLTNRGEICGMFSKEDIKGFYFSERGKNNERQSNKDKLDT